MMTASFLCSPPEKCKGPFMGLRKFLKTGGLLKVTKNAFHLKLKALFLLKIFKFLSCLFAYVGKQLDKKANFNSKLYNTQTR